MRPMPRWTDALRWTAVFTMVAVLPWTASAQSLPGRVHGRVLDGSSGEPLPGATVLLSPVEPGALATSRTTGGTSGVLGTVTGVEGAYAFDDLPAGRYLLRVERIGYRAARVGIAVGTARSPRLSVGLEVEPIALEPVDVVARGRLAGGADVRARPVEGSAEATEALRRRRYLEPDVRVFTGHELADAPTFGEPDLLRALQRVPGVSTRDEFSAELWTRGSPWGQSRLYLDDLPVFDPFLGGGALTAIGVASVGGVFLHPGARPVSVGEGGAGVARVGTRPARDVEGLPLLAELGLGTAQVTAERRFLGGRGGVLVSRRRSWYDQVWNGVVDDGHDPEGVFDFVAGSSLTRIDVSPTARTEVVLSAFDAHNDLGGNAAGLVTGTKGAWGSSAHQLAVTVPMAGGSARVSLGRSRHHARVVEAPEAYVAPLEDRVVTLRPGSTRLRYDKVAVELAPGGSDMGLALGADVTRQSVRSSGVSAPAATSTGSGLPSGFDVVSPWVEARRRLAGRVDVQLGLRLDVGAAPMGASSVRPAPHLAVRTTVDEAVHLSAAMGRTYQYMQGIGDAGTRFAGGRTFGTVWILADERVPALRVDIGSVGGEVRLPRSWWLSTTAWRRRSTGAINPDPEPGAFRDTPVRWRAGRNEAHGLEVQARRLVGVVTADVGYAWLSSTDVVDGQRRRSAAERTHGLDAMVRWNPREGLTVGGSLEAYSGAPDTRVVEDPCLDARGDTGGCPARGPIETRGEAAGLTGPAYASLDAFAAWVVRHDDWGWGATLQLHNVTDRRNRGGYRGTDCPAGTTPADCVVSPLARDRFQPLMGGLMPSLTLRVWF